MDAARHDQILLLGDFNDGGHFNDYGDYGDYGTGHLNGHSHGLDHHSSIHLHDEKNIGFRDIFGTVDVDPSLVLAGVSAVGALSLLALYIGATQNANGKRKRRRRFDDYSPHPLFDHVEPYLVAGKEQF